MPEVMLLKESGSAKFKVFIDYDDEGNIEFSEFSTDDFSCTLPSELIYANVFCDEETQEEWQIFIEEIASLVESKRFLEKIKKLEEIDDSFYENIIKIVLVEKDDL